MGRQRQQGHGTRLPLWETWEPPVAARVSHGVEITSWEPKQAGASFHTSHRADYTRPELPPPHHPAAHAAPADRLFEGTSTTHNVHHWPHGAEHMNARQTITVVPGAGPADPWPVVSFHGRVPSEERVLRDAAIDEEERRAWRKEAKVMPERLLYHGEDEARIHSKPPLSRAGGYPTRGRAPQRQPHRAGGSSYACARSSAPPPNVTWRQHERAAPAARRAAAEAHLQPPPSRDTIRTRADDHARSDMSSLLRPESAPSANAVERSATPTDRHTLKSAAAWKREQRARGRTALPGGARDAAATGFRIAPDRGAWTRGSRVVPTGAGCEPVPIGVSARPRSGAHKLAEWGACRARRYQ